MSKDKLKNKDLNKVSGGNQGRKIAEPAVIKPSRKCGFKRARTTANPTRIEKGEADKVRIYNDCPNCGMLVEINNYCPNCGHWVE